MADDPNVNPNGAQPGGIQPLGAPPNLAPSSPPLPTFQTPPSAQPIVAPLDPAARAAFKAQRLDLKRQAEERAEARVRETLASLGISDIEAYKNDQKKLAEEHARLRQAEDQRQRESLSKQESLELDLRNAQTKIADLEQQLQAAKYAKAEQDQDSMLRSTAKDFVDPELLDEVVGFHFRRHVRELMETDPKANLAIDKTYVRNWVRKFVEKRPKFALQATQDPTTTTPAAPPEARKPAVRRVINRVTTSANKPAPRPSDTSGSNGPTQPTNLAGKTPLPGLPNSMNKDELREYAKTQGVNNMPR